MDYKKLHEDTINRLQQMVGCGKITVEVARGICADFIPESEADKIRKELINFIKQEANSATLNANRLKFKSMLAWLEKHGEQKPTDKIEPKFKVGDWVVNNNGEPRVFRVEKRDWPDSIISSPLGNQFINTDTLNKQFHLWTIQDAKDGDILELDCGIGIFKDKCIDGCNIHCYCYYSNQCVLEINKDSLYDTYQSHPATKEQCDLMFQKMKESGYEWDAEKKEVKKIEQKPTWSEEDEVMLGNALWACKEKYCSTETYNWLKSIKERV